MAMHGQNHIKFKGVNTFIHRCLIFNMYITVQNLKYSYCFRSLRYCIL